MAKRPAIIAVGLVLVAVGLGVNVLWRPEGTPPIIGVVRMTEIRVAPEVGGQLAAIKVHKGDRVHAGDVVAELSALELTASVAQARAALDAATASRNNVYAGVRAEEIASLAAGVAKAKATLEYAQVQLIRTATLARSNNAAQQALDQAENEAAAARADVAEAQANHDSAVAGPTREERAIADAQVKAAASALAVLERRLDKTILRAPADGVVTVDRRRDRREHPRRPAGAGDRGDRQALAVVQRTRGSASRPHGRGESRRGAAGSAQIDAGGGHRARAARVLRNLAGRARGRRSRPQHAALAA